MILVFDIYDSFLFYELILVDSFIYDNDGYYIVDYYHRVSLIIKIESNEW